MNIKGYFSCCTVVDEKEKKREKDIDCIWLNDE